jgi:hypothetical protein
VFKFYEEGQMPMAKKFALQLRDKEMIAFVCRHHTKFWKHGVQILQNQ